MIFLDKTNQAAINFVSNFINRNWLDQGNGIEKYQNINYGDIKNPVREFREFFVVEQSEKCCYCCRDIVNDHKTELEHIIPRAKSEVDDFEPYFMFSSVLRDNVVPQKNFETATNKLNTPPFPHHIAYHNIVASCNGKPFQTTESLTCCNRERKDSFIPPFNLLRDSVAYMPDGTIVYMDDLANREYFDILNLSKDILVNFRRFWYLFSKSDITLVEIFNFNLPQLAAKIIEYAIANSTTVVDDTKLVGTFSNENVWNTFLQYSYFFNYYRSTAN